MELLAWIEQTDFSTWLRESDWGQPILLCFHAVGMGMVVGISFMFAARVLGFSKDFPVAAFDKLFGLAWFGFAMNTISGVLLFLSEPHRLLQTPAFLVKMVLILCAGFALWMLSKALEGGVDVPASNRLPRPDGALVGNQEVTATAKAAAVLSVLCWLGAILAGRLIGYTIPPP
jgi:hypothetical protein